MNVKSKINNIIAIVVLSAMSTACGQLRESAPSKDINLVMAEFGSLDQASLLDKYLFDNLLAPKAYAAVPLALAEMRMCFKRLRFKTVEEVEENAAATAEEDLEDNVDLALGEVIFDGSVNLELDVVSIPEDDYRRIEFDLEDGCGSGYSLWIDNGVELSTDERMTIKFEGLFTIDSSSTDLFLGIDQIATALVDSTAGEDLKVDAEAASGEISE